LSCRLAKHYDGLPTHDRALTLLGNGFVIAGFGVCEIKRIYSSSHCPLAADFKITLNVAGETEIIEMCKEQYEGALSQIGMLMRYWPQFELKVEQLQSESKQPGGLGKIA